MLEAVKVLVCWKVQKEINLMAPSPLDLTNFVTLVAFRKPGY